MKLKNIVICASLGLFSAMSLSAQAVELEINREPSFPSVDYFKKIYDIRDTYIKQRESIIKDIASGKNNNFKQENIGKLEWVKSFSDYDVGLSGNGYVVKIIDNETKQPRYFGANTTDKWVTPNNVITHDFYINGFNYSVYDVNPLPIKDSLSINTINNMKGSDVLVTHPQYLKYKDFYPIFMNIEHISYFINLTDETQFNKEDLFDTYIININDNLFYAKEMFKDNNVLSFKYNNSYSGVDTLKNIYYDKGVKNEFK